MTGAEYRLFFDGTAATREQLDRVEAITVEQEVDRPWQARLEIPVCLDDQGNWSATTSRSCRSFAASASRSGSARATSCR